jgi:CubicO group peptidase (beta-lactamase class C family)
MTVSGFARPGYESVLDAFERNLASGSETGAAFTAIRDGEQIVSCWGGLAGHPQGRPWTEDTVAVIFSGTKGLLAACMLLLVDRGLLDIEAPVCRYWPEFAVSGKSAIRVRDCLSHTARLPGITQPVTVTEITDSAHMARVLAGQAPSSDPRAALAYHPLTFGWICDELIRRVDGRSAGEFFAGEFASALSLDIWIGLPAGLEQRVSCLELHSSWPADAEAGPQSHDPLWRAINANPPVFDRKRFPWNSRLYHAAGIPSAGGIASARSMAQFYAHLPEKLSPQALRAARTPLATGVSALTGEKMRFSAGFQLQVDDRFGPAPGAFGHGGAGGSLHGRWPEQRIAFSYVTNLLRDDDRVNDRAHSVLRALWSTVGDSRRHRAGLRQS